MFPEINRLRKASTQIGVFGGLNRTENCGFARVNGKSSAYVTELSETENLCGDGYPQLKTRAKRSVQTLVATSHPDGNILIAGGKLIFLSKNSLGQAVLTLMDANGGADHNFNAYYDDSEDHYLTLYGNRVVIMPERMYFDLTAQTFSPIDCKTVTSGIDTGSTDLNAATYNGLRQGEPVRNFRDFSIEKVALGDDGKPVNVDYIFEKAHSLEDYSKQTKLTDADYTGDNDETIEAWQKEYYTRWNVSVGSTVEAQGEKPSGVYLCVNRVFGSKTGTSPNVVRQVTAGGITYTVNTYLNTFVKLESTYVKITRTGNNVFAGIQKGDFVKISDVTAAVKKPLTISNNVYWAGVDAQSDYPEGYWGNYAEVLNGNTFKVYYADSNCIVIKAAIDKSVPYTGPMTVERTMPDTQNGMMLEVNNRLWACSSTNNEIYSCKQGDCTNWQAYGDGISTDSYAATAGCEGEFTGIARQNDSVLFFKENWILKLFGNKPANYTLACYNVPGVEKGSENSVVWVNGVLYYLSHLGVCQYSPGGQPVVVSDKAFGQHKYRNGVAGRHRNKYVLSAQNENNAWELLVLDTETGLWYREDNTHMKYCATYNNVLYYVNATDDLVCMDKGNNLLYAPTVESDFAWSFETPNLYENEFAKKYISRVQIGIRASDSLSATVWAQFSPDGAWAELRQLHHLAHRHALIGVPVRRADYLRLRIEGTGECEISGIQVDFARGSEKVWQY